jgi:cytochrome P450
VADRVRGASEFIRSFAAGLIKELVPLRRYDFIEDFARKLSTVVFIKLADLPFEDHAKLGGFLEELVHPDDLRTRMLPSRTSKPSSPPHPGTPLPQRRSDQHDRRRIGRKRQIEHKEAINMAGGKGKELA